MAYENHSSLTAQLHPFAKQALVPRPVCVERSRSRGQRTLEEAAIAARLSLRELRLLSNPLGFDES